MQRCFFVSSFDRCIFFQGQFCSLVFFIKLHCLPLPKRRRDARGGRPRDDLSPVREHDDDADGGLRGNPLLLLLLCIPLLVLLLLPFLCRLVLLLLLCLSCETSPPEGSRSEHASRVRDPGGASSRRGRGDSPQVVAHPRRRRRRRGGRRGRSAGQKDAAARGERPAALGPESGGDESGPERSSRILSSSFFPGGLSLQRLSHLRPRARDGERGGEERRARLPSPRFQTLPPLLPRRPLRVLALGARLFFAPRALAGLAFRPVVRVEGGKAGVVGAERGGPSPLALSCDGDAFAAKKRGCFFGAAPALFLPRRRRSSAPAPAAPADAAALARDQGPPHGQGPPCGDDEGPVREAERPMRRRGRPRRRRGGGSARRSTKK